MDAGSPANVVGSGLTAYKLIRGGASYITGLWGSTEEAPTAIPGLEKSVERLAFIISIALRGFLAEGFKPSLENYRIVWDPPDDKKVTGALTISKQGYDRSFKGERATRDIMRDWDVPTEKALQRYNPFSEENIEKTDELEKKRKVQIKELFELAIVGFEATPGPYKIDKDQTTKEILKTVKKCSEQIKNDRQSKRTYLPEPGNFALKEPKDVWDSATIDYIYHLFQKLKTLQASQDASEVQLRYDTIQAIDAIVNYKCTEWAVLHKNELASIV